MAGKWLEIMQQTNLLEWLVSSGIQALERVGLNMLKDSFINLFSDVKIIKS